MYKMGSYCPFGHLKHKLWPKERSRVKLTIWLPTTKNRESTRPWCVQVDCDTRWKVLNEGYNFASDLIAIGGLHKKFCAFKVARVLIVEISGFGSPGTKSHLDVALVESCRVYYMGKGGGFPRVRTVVSLVSLVSLKSPVACPCTKGAP
jgi:hypothetical protein